jgi:serine/threonine protein kinase
MNGTIPFYIPNIQLDIQYRYINSGQLKQHILHTVGTNHHHQQQQYISNDVMDLLQNMLWYDPNKRLSLEQIMIHPWITSSTSTITSTVVNNK